MQIELKGRYNGESSELLEAQDLLNGSWSASCEAYAAKYWACEALGKKPPMGVQPFLNSVLDERFEEAGWVGGDGRYTKSDTWFRVTFRHQMSLGSDLIDGLLLSKRERIKQIVVAAAAPDFARIITPRDANSIVNFEKLDAYFARAKEIFAVDAAIGRLTISQSPPPEVNNLILSRQLIAEG